MVPNAPALEERLVVTDGRTLFGVDRPWARLPSGRDFGFVSQLTVDRRDRVILSQRTDPAILIFAPDGSLDAAWHHPKLASVHGLCMAPDDTLLVTSFDLHQVLRFDLEGRLLQEIGSFNRPNWAAPFNHPTGVAVAPDGDLLVSDGYGNACIHRFDPEGRLLASWGEPGTGPGQFSCPHAVWVTLDGRVLAADRDNDRIQVFTGGGEFVEEWTGFCKPMDVWSDGTTIYVSDQTPRLNALDMAGRVVGRARMFAVYPHGLSGDSRGNLFIAEQIPSGVTRLAPLG